ncbi:hypothetical protein P7K49_024966 [Saguinus oedipus]|uniref:Uncharacterized protein n=1 Tax=Saguinus oedipus TaxID=9490 RepID=A0ABQ9UI34_SAGOE|nr:hypothetical protein P7K49_024966 [Saguinus oedipus]
MLDQLSRRPARTRGCSWPHPFPLPAVRRGFPVVGGEASLLSRGGTARKRQRRRGDSRVGHGGESKPERAGAAGGLRAGGHREVPNRLVGGEAGRGRGRGCHGGGSVWGEPGTREELELQRGVAPPQVAGGLPVSPLHAAAEVLSHPPHPLLRRLWTG